MTGYLLEAGKFFKGDMRQALLSSTLLVVPCLAGGVMLVVAAYQYLLMALPAPLASLVLAGGFFVVALVFWLCRVLMRGRRDKAPQSSQLLNLVTERAQSDPVTTHLVAFGAGLACGYDPALLKLARQVV